MNTSHKKEKTELCILITGACGVTSRAILKSLKLSNKFKNSRFIGTDNCSNEYGIYEGLFSRIYKVPIVYDKNYHKLMGNIIREEKVDVAVVMPEIEVNYWSGNPFNVKYIVPPPLFSNSAISKKNLYESLSDSNLIPKFQVEDRINILTNGFKNEFDYPLWIRDFSEGSSSGNGALKVESSEQLKAWVLLNTHIQKFMIAEFLPGRNFACHLLYYHGKLLKIGIYERLEYFMSKVVLSGISGNISKGKLVNNEVVSSNAMNAVNFICNKNSEIMHGLVAVDLREDSNGIPLITEINLRHVACTLAFSLAGFNLAEDQLLCALGRLDEISIEVEYDFPPKNLILRDIDGHLIWLPEHNPLEIGEHN